MTRRRGAPQRHALLAAAARARDAQRLRARRARRGSSTDDTRCGAAQRAQTPARTPCAAPQRFRTREREWVLTWQVLRFHKCRSARHAACVHPAARAVTQRASGRPPCSAQPPRKPRRARQPPSLRQAGALDRCKRMLTLRRRCGVPRRPLLSSRVRMSFCAAASSGKRRSGSKPRSPDSEGQQQRTR